SSRFAGPTTASSIALDTKPHGGKDSTLIQFQWRSGCGSKRGQTIQPALRRELSPRHQRKVKLLTKLPSRRLSGGRHARGYNDMGGGGSHCGRSRIRRSNNRRPPRNLAHSEQTFPNLAAALLLRGDRGRGRRGGDRVGARSA